MAWIPSAGPRVSVMGSMILGCVIFIRKDFGDV